MKRLALLLALLPACANSTIRDLEGTMPVDVQPDYQLFSHRCSKCHSLSRPLQSGITDQKMWESYVNRMRLQPGSGIAVTDVPPILRFLAYYTHWKLERDADRRRP
jgi:hypothetical protein